MTYEFYGADLETAEAQDALLAVLPFTFDADSKYSDLIEEIEDKEDNFLKLAKTNPEAFKTFMLKAVEHEDPRARYLAGKLALVSAVTDPDLTTEVLMNLLTDESPLVRDSAGWVPDMIRDRTDVWQKEFSSLGLVRLGKLATAYTKSQENHEERNADSESTKSTEIYRDVTFSKIDVIQFAKETNYANVTESRFESGPGSADAINASLAGLAWKSLVNLSRSAVTDEQQHQLIDLEKVPTITNIDKLEGYRAINQFATFAVDSIANFITFIEEFKLNNPDTAMPDLLGRGFGEGRLDLLKKFVEFKRQQLAQIENPET